MTRSVPARGVHVISGLLLSVMLVACGDDEPTGAAASQGSTGGAGGGVGGAGGSGSGAGGAGGAETIPCDEQGVSKGPWVLAVNGSEAKVRWEACIEGTSSEIVVTPEAGGTPSSVTGSESAYTVENTYVAAFLPDVPPDAAGTYYMHEVPVTGLTPGTCYRYELVSSPTRTGRFCTARASGDEFTFMAIADTNPGLGTYCVDTLAQVVPSNFDFTVHGGDIQYYASGLETWASWFPMMQPMLSQGAFYPAIGNHEYEQLDEYEAYVYRYFGEAGFDGTNGYYRVESGGMWFFAIDNESEDIVPGTPEGDWLAANLADAASQPGFRGSVLFFHHPLVTCGDVSSHTDDRLALQPLFAQYGVKLILQGHMHGYERFDLDGFTYITTGGGGGALGDIDDNIDRPECVSRVASGAFRHAMVFDVAATDLFGRAVDDQGVIQDAFQIPLP